MAFRRMFMSTRREATSGLERRDRDDDDLFAVRGSVHCTCFRRGVGAGRLLGEEVGRGEETEVRGMAGDGEGEGRVGALST